MAWSWSKSNKGGERGDPWSMEQPVSKKRKLETEKQGQKLEKGESKDEWDDSLELTQADIETLDVIASQAISQSHPSDTAPSTSAQTVDKSFAVPGKPTRTGTNQSTSSSSDSSHHPHSLSSRSSSDTSGSLSSHPSSNGKVDPAKDMVQVVQAKLEEEIKRAQEERYRFNGEVKYLRESLHKQEEELEKLRAKRDEAQDQQKQMQSDKERNLQAQVDSLTSQAQFKERDFKELQEQFQAMQQKLKKVEQQQQANISTDLDVKLPQSPKPASPRKVPVRPSPPSKQQQKLNEEAPGSSRQSFPTRMTFMEKGASTSPVISPAKSSTSSVLCQTTGTASATEPPQNRRLSLKINASKALGEVPGNAIVCHLLQASGSPSQIPDGSEIHQWDPGLTGLLHAMSTSLRVVGLTYNRGKDSTFLSPVKPKRSKQLSRSPGPESGDGSVQIVSKENFQLAIEGLSLLLENSDDGNKELSCTESHSSGNLFDRLAHGSTKPSEISSRQAMGSYSTERDKSSSDEKDQNLSAKDKQNASDERDTKENHPKRQLSLTHKQNLNTGASMLLPLLTDYILNYAELIVSSRTTVSSNTSVYPNPQSISSLESSSLSSLESSLDSLSSYVLQLLHEGRVYATSVEGYAVSALRCISLLTQLCPSLGHTIVSSQSVTSLSHPGNGSTTTTTSSSTNVETESECPLDKKTTSGAEADDEYSTGSSEVRIMSRGQGLSFSSHPGTNQHVGHRGGDSSVLLHLILRLAGQDLEESNSSPTVVKEALEVLTHLCNCCLNEYGPKLEMIITRGILTNCFKQTKHLSVILHALQLLGCLAKSEKLLARLCAKSENCPLYLMHRVFSNRSFDAQGQNMVILYKEYINCLSSIISEHRQSMSLFLTNTCPCTDELVMAVVLALYNLFNVYKMAQRGPAAKSLLNTLAQGVILIHTLAQGDQMFVTHHAGVQLQYVRFLSGLATVMRPDRQNWEFHLSALEELCDFEPDAHDMSQEEKSSTEEMDQS